MVRQISTLLGVGLVILWIAELSYNVAPWLTWLNLAAAICAFGIAVGVNERSIQGARVGAPIVLSLGLFALWIIGLAGNVPAWQVWWNFAFACAFLLTGLGAISNASRLMGGRSSDYGLTGRSTDKGPRSVGNTPTDVVENELDRHGPSRAA